MIKKVTIIQRTGKFQCGMEEESLDKFIREINQGDSIPQKQLINLSDFLPENARGDTSLYINPASIEGVMVGAVSNIAVPSKQIVMPGKPN